MFAGYSLLSLLLSLPDLSPEMLQPFLEPAVAGPMPPSSSSTAFASSSTVSSSSSSSSSSASDVEATLLRELAAEDASLTEALRQTVRELSLSGRVNSYLKHQLSEAEQRLGATRAELGRPEAAAILVPPAGVGMGEEEGATNGQLDRVFARQDQLDEPLRRIAMRLQQTA